MTAATVTDLNSWVARMMKTLNIKDYDLDIGGNSAKGDGYMGEVAFVKVKTPKKLFDIVIKSAKNSDELRKQTPIKEAYDREIFFYSKMFPILDEFQKQKAVEKPFANIPTCYMVSSENKKEALLLENLKPQGFDVHDRTTPMNLNHIHAVFAQYGRFHALSLALRDQKPAIFKSVTKNMSDIIAMFTIQGKMLGNFQKNFAEVKELLQDTPLICKKYDGFENEIETIMTKFADENNSTSVILHGDCWNNNFLFKYKDSDRTRPSEMNFIDFQLSRVGSPVLDLSYFLYCCADQQVLKDIDFILQAYHSSLSDFLTELGSDPETIYPLKTLQQQWKIYGKFGLVMALFILKISLCDTTEAPDFSESAEKGDFGSSMFFEIKEQDKYNRRIKDVFVHFAEKFL